MNMQTIEITTDATVNKWNLDFGPDTKKEWNQSCQDNAVVNYF